MVGLTVTFQIKPSSVSSFILHLEQEAHPRLRKEKGFRGNLAFFDPAGLKALSISVWEKDAAVSIDRVSFLLLLALAGVMEGRPTSRVYGEVRTTPNGGGALQAAMTLLGKGECLGIIEVSTATFQELNVPSLH